MTSKFKYEKLTPMLRHYVDVKNDFKDALLLYRVGDFYETFFDDAIITAKVLSLTLTGKECGHVDRAPMCGVPHHVIDTYVNRLVKKGYKVALCDQIEDPKDAKGLVKRAITRVITPGTLTDMESLENKENNYLLSIFENEYGLAMAYCDISTGKLVGLEIKTLSQNLGKKAIDQIEKINPSEMVLTSNFDNEDIKKYLNLNNQIFINYINFTTDYENRVKTVNNYLGKDNLNKIKDKRLIIVALANLLDYIYKYYEEKLDHINNIEILKINEFMEIESNTRKNLELTRNLSTNNKENTLISILDEADTVMGSRMIHDWLERPLIDRDKINRRLDLVDGFYEDSILSRNVSNLLDSVYDLERLLAKISYKRANARDLISLKNSIKEMPKLKHVLADSTNNLIKNLGLNLPDVEDIYELINKSIVDEPPINITEGGIIKSQYDKDLDNLKEMADTAEDKLIEYESKQRELTGIKNLKVIFNKNNGYSIEVTKSNIDKIDQSYIRKQTLKNQERYTTEELENISSLILNGKEKINLLEYELFNKIVENILNSTLRLQSLSKMIANIDSLNSFAKIAHKYSYCKPNITESNEISIIEGRHPVIEINLDENEFIANDTNIGQDDNLIQIITGPNMAGKSTYMRQMALIIIMAQIGSFVPAKSAEIGICDKIFTRIGASDNISKGESTFMLEMNEVSNIIKNSTEKSFVILDEVGRGTSSDDGLSIAMALVEYLSKHKKVKTVFATHFHELTVLESELKNVRNLKIEILEENNNLIFLRKISRGKSDRSYGIEVAKLSGLPDEILENAKNIMEKLANEDFFEVNKGKEIKNSLEDIKNKKINELKSYTDKININELTPLEAMNQLNILMEKIGEI
ncbi:DNA mismatch repair protein MutS [Anaerococcus lactolyticus]|uniref:DNA mismatch repair protein MutS n=1 Tax=Anaerococcus lactolyticus S7-1-13 TaxID=1284686 RepID=A0A095Z3V1_9FIRM|nr:DNA mismatch repair protein MutS [Anaerococcus lactolyticus]KGF03164.1 DNA mismatch repair protein MutS [Anaerococcus lactolyticus S7-1-13]